MIYISLHNRNLGDEKVQGQIIRIEDSIVSLRLEDGYILDVDRRWFPSDINIDEELDFSVDVAKN